MRQVPWGSRGSRERTVNEIRARLNSLCRRPLRRESGVYATATSTRETKTSAGNRRVISAGSA